MASVSGRFGEEHRLLRESVRAFVNREVRPELEAWERAGEVPRELHRKAGALGLLGASWPESLGGGGGDVWHSTVVTEELIQAGGIALQLQFLGDTMAKPEDLKKPVKLVFPIDPKMERAHPDRPQYAGPAPSGRVDLTC